MRRFASTSAGIFGAAGVFGSAGVIGLVFSAWALCPAGPSIRAASADDAPPPGPAVPATPPAANEGQRLFEQGEVLREEGKWDEAAAAYGHALDQDESAWTTHVRYQEAVTSSGKAKELVAEYDEMVKKRTDDPLIRLHRLRLDPPATRVPALQKLLAAKPNDAYLMLEIGRAQLAAGDAAAAKKTLEVAYARKPGDTGEILLLSVEALRLSGGANDARSRLESAVTAKPDLWEAHLALGRLDVYEGKVEDAKRRAEQVLAMRPSYIAAFLLKSEAASRLGKMEDALSALESALRVNPTDGDATIALAELTARSGTDEGLKKAFELLKRVVTANPGCLRGQYGLGWVLERQNMLPESLAAYREALGIAPLDPGVVNSIGVILLKQKRFQDAVGQFTKAIDLDSDAPEAYNNMGAVSDAQSDWNGAIKWYEKVLHLKGQDKNVRALLNSAFDYEALTTYPKAEDLLQKVRTLRPEDDEVITFLGDNLSFQHKWKSAIKAYQDAVKINPKNRFGWRGLGNALAQDEKPEDAVDALEHAKAIKGDDQQVLLLLGDLYVDLDNKPKAVENYEAYVKAGGNNPDIPPLIEQLKADIAAGKK